MEAKVAGDFISIHAPVKGATGFNGDDFLAALISIHAPVKGATCNGPSVLSRSRYFNPRSREGSDMSEQAQQQVEIEFQSTLP